MKKGQIVEEHEAATCLFGSVVYSESVKLML